jgi:beta-glucosidase
MVVIKHIFFSLVSAINLIQALPHERSESASPLSYYPSPWMDSNGEWADAYAKAAEFVSKLTLLEKVNLTTGLG